MPVSNKEARMRKTTIYLFLLALLLNCVVLAQVEDLPLQGVIPFELKEHLIMIKGKINDSRAQYNFLLDTGGLTFIDRKVAEELGLKIKGNMAKINTLEIGEVSIPNIFAFMGFNLGEFKKHGFTFHGMIGSNLLDRFDVTIDYRKQRVILSSKSEANMERSRGQISKFTNHPVNYAPMIDCRINGDTSVKAMVDTGQPYSIVFPLEYLDKLNARSDEQLIKSKGVMIKWPGTSTTDSYLWRIDKFEQQNLKINNLVCCFAELPPLLSVPLLGKDYLCQFLITIDYPKDEILFVPYEDAKFVKNIFSFGMNLSKGKDNTVVVEGLWTGGPADKAGIKVGDEIVECNSAPLNADDIFKIRQLIKNEDMKEIRVVFKNQEGQREVRLQKEMLFD
jgi:predicted aspartyl protease